MLLGSVPGQPLLHLAGHLELLPILQDLPRTLLLPKGLRFRVTALGMLGLSGFSQCPKSFGIGRLGLGSFQERLNSLAFIMRDA